MWEDADGVRHNIEQHEGEQGDPLMPMLFSLGLHNALEEVQQLLDPGEFLFAYLDDVFILSSPERTREIFNLLENTLPKRAGIHLHTGKTRVWNVCGEQPPDIDNLGEEVWSPSGVMILGTPLGSGEFMSRIVGFHPLDPRFAVRLAGAHPMRRTSLPSSVTDRPSQFDCKIRHGTRRRYVADHGSTVGHNPRRPFRSSNGTDLCHVANEDWWPWHEVSGEDGPSSVLGVVG